jgi:RHS repeat-associated protein
MHFSSQNTANTLNIKGDYYPFGSLKPLRHSGSNNYRFSFNGMEADNEVKGNNNSLDFGARIYDPRIGRWLSLDPLMKKYPSMSPYNGFANNPILFIDPDGREIKVARIERKGKKPLIKVSFTAEIVNISSESISKNQLTNISNSISDQIKDSYGGEYESFEVEVSVEIQVRESFNDVTGDPGHVISIVSPDHKDLKTTDGEIGVGASERVSSKYGNIIISSDIINNIMQLKRTGAHEFGHAAGLEHPQDDDATKIDEAAGKNPKNLLHQSKVSTGTEINGDQIKQIEKDND